MPEGAGHGRHAVRAFRAPGACKAGFTGQKREEHLPCNNSAQLWRTGIITLFATPVYGCVDRTRQLPVPSLTLAMASPVIFIHQISSPSVPVWRGLIRRQTHGIRQQGHSGR